MSIQHVFVILSLILFLQAPSVYALQPTLPIDNPTVDGLKVATLLGDRARDTKLRAKIKIRIWEDKQLNNTDIDVDVRDGRVTLTGVVNDANQFRRVDTLIRNIEDVDVVENHITVSGAPNQAKEPFYERGLQAIDDGATSVRVRTNLRTHGLHEGTDIDVKTLNDAVVLEGYVNTWDQYNKAAEVAKKTPGVQKVINRLKVH